MHIQLILLRNCSQKLLYLIKKIFNHQKHRDFVKEIKEDHDQSTGYTSTAKCTKKRKSL